MKWAVLVLSLLVVFTNHQKTAAQSTINQSSMSPTSTFDISTTSDMPMMSPSISLTDTINITDMSATVTMDIDMNTTDMTLTMEITNTLVTIESTPTSPSTFTMTVTTMFVSTPTMPTTSIAPSSSSAEPTTSSTSTTATTATTDIISMPSPTDNKGSDDGLGTGVIIGIAAGGGAAFLVILVILIICCCCCYQKRHREESYNIGPTVTARYWDANHPNDAGPGHVTSGGSMRSRTSWRDSLRSFTRGSLRRSLSLRRSSKRAKDKQQPSEYIGLYSTPL